MRLYYHYASRPSLQRSFQFDKRLPESENTLHQRTKEVSTEIPTWDTGKQPQPSKKSFQPDMQLPQSGTIHDQRTEAPSSKLQPCGTCEARPV